MSRREDWMDPDARHAWDHDDPLEADDDALPVVAEDARVVSMAEAMAETDYCPF